MFFRRTQVHAPEIHGRGGWVNTGGESLSLADLRGRVVVLDFWTSSCINCIHVLEELRELEKKYTHDQLAVIGIHSPKFEHEGDHDAVVAAVGRNGIDHPVLDDPDLVTWSAYAVSAWPTLVIVDQEGHVAYVAAGEQQLPALIREIDRLLGVTGQNSENTDEGSEKAGPEDARKIRYPSNLTLLPDGTLLLANTGNHNLLQLTADGNEVIRVIGSGVRGARDGDSEEAQFSEPTAALYLDRSISPEVQYDIIVVDRGNHALRTISLQDGQVATLADRLISPWNIVYWAAIDRLVIAMAGRHFIAGMDLRKNEISVIAGNGREGIGDGNAKHAKFAQPTGLAAEPGPNGSLWVIDSETSALRRLRTTDAGIFVETAIGRSLFDFGHIDGAANQALLQHPQGVALTDNHEVVIADTFNGAIRKYNPSTKQVSTVVGGLQEPTGVLVSGADLLIVESAANRIVKAQLDAGTQPMYKDSLSPVRDTPTIVAPNLQVNISLSLPEPMSVDGETKNPIRVTVSSTPEELVSHGSGLSYELIRQLELNEAIDSGIIHISATVACCDQAKGLCTLITQDWNPHVQIKADGAREVTLILSGPS